VGVGALMAQMMANGLGKGARAPCPPGSVGGAGKLQ